MLKRILISSGYLLLTALVLAITAGLVAYGNGYTYNFKSGRIIRTGLIIIQSSPSGLPVTFEGKLLKKKTPYRISVEAGNYRFSLAKDGFYPWTKVINVIASEVSVAQYVLLVPKKPEVTTMDSKTAVISQAVSRDHRHLAYVASGPEAGVYTLDITNKNAKPVRLYQPRAATDVQPAETLSDVFWSDDASHLLIVSKVGEVVTHRLAPAGGGDIINLTTQYGFNFSGIQFSGSGWQQLYWLSPDGLRKLDIGSQSVSGVLADKVSQFVVVDSRVLYVQSSDIGRMLWSIDGRGRKQEIIQALPESGSYSIASSRYNNQDYLAVVPARTGVATLYSGIYDANPVSKVIARGVSLASFSPDGHLLIVNSPTTVLTYDLERSDVDNKAILYQFPASDAQVDQISWFDDFHVLMTRGGRLVWSEFDGANQVDLGPTLPTVPAYSTSDARSIINFVTEDASTKLKLTTIKQ